MAAREGPGRRRIVLLAGCVLVFRQRAGIVLLHGGVALLMCSELWTGLTANEAQMTIAEGQTANYASDIRTTELAVIDRSDPEHDRVTVVPAVAALEATSARPARIEHADLPFTMQVLRWLREFVVCATRKAGEPNPATAGTGRQLCRRRGSRRNRHRHGAERRSPGRLRRAVLEGRPANRSAPICSAADFTRAAGRGRRQDVRRRPALQANLLSVHAHAQRFPLRPLHRHEHAEELFVARATRRTRRKTSTAKC